MSLTSDILLTFATVHRRADAWHRLAAHLGCEAVAIAAPGTESDAPDVIAEFEGQGAYLAQWPGTLREAARDGCGTVMLPHPRSGRPMRASLAPAPDGSLLVALGGMPRPHRLAWAARLVPLLRRVAHGDDAEARAARASADATAARSALADAEAHAAEATRLKDDFLATLSHELRTPLNTILGWVQMLRAYPDDETVRTRALEVLDRNARVQAQLVADLVDVSRIIAGTLRLCIGPVDLPRIVRAACASLAPIIEDRGHHLTLDAGGVRGVVLGDENRLRQVVWNLVSNAVKFTPPGGRIGVRLEDAGPFVSITVTDTGVGIPPAFLPHVFDRFRQCDSTLTRPHGGLGVGLTIVRYLVEQHGGTVTAASDGPGRGATFTVRLPCREARSSSGEKEETPQATA